MTMLLLAAKGWLARCRGSDLPADAKPVGFLLAAVLLLLLCFESAAEESAAPGSSGPVAVGDPMPALSLNDQYGTRLDLDAATRVVLFTRDMDGGALVKEVLAEDGAAQLAAAHAVYVSDVSAMPGLIRRMFALPSLRKRPYPIALDEEGLQTGVLPGQEGRVTILTLDSGRVAEVSFVATTQEVRAALGP